MRTPLFSLLLKGGTIVMGYGGSCGGCGFAGGFALLVVLFILLIIIGLLLLKLSEKTPLGVFSLCEEHNFRLIRVTISF